MVRIKLFIFLLALVVFPFQAATVSADTNVSGTISQNTTWTQANGPYIVTDNVTVNSGVELTIEPGAVVKFDSDKALIINGELDARGTETDRIVFTSNQSVPNKGDWQKQRGKTDK